jgi:hypothetical protein
MVLYLVSTANPFTLLQAVVPRVWIGRVLARTITFLCCLISPDPHCLLILPCPRYVHASIRDVHDGSDVGLDRGSRQQQVCGRQRLTSTGQSLTSLLAGVAKALNIIHTVERCLLVCNSGIHGVLRSIAIHICNISITSGGISHDKAAHQLRVLRR